jgi:alpha-beta hydrolase superfamily lysophospholipase
MKINEIALGNIYLKQYMWDTPDPKAAVLILHGFADHAKRYEHLAQFFVKNNFGVMSYDMRGHGESEGTRAYVKHFQSYIDDLQTVLTDFEREYDEIPRFLFGHSMGGLVAAYASAKNKLNEIDYVILSNPALDIESNQPKFLVWLIQFLSKIAPKTKTIKLDSKTISRDPKVVKAYEEDPLVYRKGTKPGMINQFNNAGRWMRNNAHKFAHPLLLLYSLSDTTVVPKASELFYEKVNSTDKEKVHFEGLYHELINEPEKDQVMETLIKWCDSRI